MAARPALAQTAADTGKLSAEVVRLYQAGKYAEAIPLAERVLAIDEKALGPNHPDVATALGNLALLYRTQGRYAEAEPLYKRSLVLREKARGAGHPDVAETLHNLAGLYTAQGRYAEAEQLYKRSLALLEKALGPNHPSIARVVNNLAVLYQDQVRYGQAEPLFKRSLALSEKALGLNHPMVAHPLGNLAGLYVVQGRHAEAEPLHKRSLAISEKALGPNHPDVATELNSLAELYRAQGRNAEAEPLYKRSLSITEKALGPNHPHVATTLNNLATLYRAQGRYAEAEPLYKQSLTLREKALGPIHPDVAKSLNHLAWLALGQHDFATASGYWRHATGVLTWRAERAFSDISEQASNKGETQRNSAYFEGLIKTTHRLAAEGLGSERALSFEMFETAQWGVGSDAAASLAQMAARSAGGSRELATLVRERQDLLAEWRAKDKQLIAAKSEPPAKRNAAGEKVLGDRLAAIDARLAAIAARFAKDFPDYDALASSKPISVADVQASLRDDEALALFLDTNDGFKPLPEETFVWVVTRSEARSLRSEIGTGALRREVAALRCGLDAAAWTGDGTERCARLLKMPLDRVAQDGEALPFDATRAHALYRSLFGEARDLIAGKNLLIVPSGALTTLPFQVLVTKPPASGDLSAVHWLIRDNAITVLPSVASLTALRRTAKPSAAERPYIGFGNPLLDGDQRHPQFGNYLREQAAIARTRTGCATTVKARTATLRVARRAVTSVRPISRLADPGHLRAQTPLPETADELCEVVRSVGGRVDDVWIGARATETEVKRLSATGELAKFRVLHFATHGTLAGQLSGTNEPGLILTPPSTATPEDDGFLSGSEIASLKLDADWVILSACNTAGGAGEGAAAEALSGLARAFFYAGVRALLVSHWEVDSDAAVKLVTGATRALSNEPGIGRAEALRRAMLAMMADTSRPSSWVPAWHPAVWAPFVVVGEGGAGK